jgi:GlpG protein
MRLIGEINDHTLAERFASYLVTQGIPAKVDLVGDTKSEIWVHEEDQLKQAQQELASFLHNPGDPKFARSISHAQQILRQQEDKRKRIQKKIIVGKRALHPHPRMTVVLIGICLLVGVFTNFGAQYRGDLYKALVFVAVPSPESLAVVERAKGDPDDLGLRTASLNRGEYWRLVTPIFVHHGVFHFLFNMFWLFYLGKMIELRYGRTYFLVLIAASAAVSNFAQCTVPEQWDGSVPILLPPPDWTLLSRMGGFSGVVYALFGVIWIKSIFDPSSRLMLPSSTVALMLIWLVFCMLPGPENNTLTEHLFGIRVANWAHAIGFLAGVVAGFLPVWKGWKGAVGGS